MLSYPNHLPALLIPTFWKSPTRTEILVRNWLQGTAEGNFRVPPHNANYLVTQRVQSNWSSCILNDGYYIQTECGLQLRIDSASIERYGLIDRPSYDKNASNLQRQGRRQGGSADPPGSAIFLFWNRWVFTKTHLSLLLSFSMRLNNCYPGWPIIIRPIEISGRGHFTNSFTKVSMD